jgi:hypothetical protein
MSHLANRGMKEKAMRESKEEMCKAPLGRFSTPCLRGCGRMIEDFLNFLAERQFSENDLSDVTWALCCSSSAFRQLFFGFIFGNDERFGARYDIDREYNVEGSRPDLHFVVGEREYVLEVKIDDKQDHYEQYSHSFPKATLGFIASYDVGKRKPFYGYVRTWDDFHRKLKTDVAQLQYNDEGKALMNAYLAYLKKVGSIMEINALNLRNVSSLYGFTILVEKIIRTYDPEICQLYAQARGLEPGSSGKYFSLMLSSGKTAYPWFGLWYYEEPHNVCMYLHDEKGWCDHLCATLNKATKWEGKLSKAPYYDADDKAYWFELKDEHMRLLQTDEGSIDAKTGILRSFFGEVIEYCASIG